MLKKLKKFIFISARSLLIVLGFLFLIGALSLSDVQAEQKSFDQTTLLEAKSLMSKTTYHINYPEPEWLVRDLQENVIDDLKDSGREVPARLVEIATIFIYEGTDSSRSIGFGERMSVIKSFYYAFDKFPETESDWQDVIKISAGRWPSQRNLKKEDEMKQVFEKIYLRQPNMSDAHDNAMITVATYGLRPQKINYEKQNIAWRYYGNTMSGLEVFPDKWEYQKMWDIIRGIAYSGASR
jgi:hypothetical protein